MLSGLHSMSASYNFNRLNKFLAEITKQISEIISKNHWSTWELWQNCFTLGLYSQHPSNSDGLRVKMTKITIDMLQYLVAQFNTHYCLGSKWWNAIYFRMCKNMLCLMRCLHGWFACWNLWVVCTNYLPPTPIPHPPPSSTDNHPTPLPMMMS